MNKISIFQFSSFICGSFLLLWGLSSCGLSASDIISVDEKQRGVHVFGKFDSTNLQPFVQNNMDWVTIVTWCNQRDYNSDTLFIFQEDSLKVLRRDSMWSSQIRIAHAAGLKVLFKPHIWITNASEGKWRSDIFPTNDNAWKAWQKEYSSFIIRYARLAEANHVEMFCVGAELSRLTVEKSAYWQQLIKDVRAIYSGKLTYAANWYNEFEKITFWDELDYIGIQAYFPLVKNEFPTVKEISKGWKQYLPTIESVHRKFNRQIIFTEMGYKSTADSAIEPWTWVDYNRKSDQTVSLETQTNCYKSFFNTVWKEDWFAGVHLWQMRCDFSGELSWSGSLDFTPQGKPAMEVIARGFGAEF